MYDDARRKARRTWPVRVLPMADHDNDADWHAMTPGQRMAIVWPITCDAWIMAGKGNVERR